ncbi:MAG: FAD-dependent oxidoreductase [Deltaproteobacteria bacterium]|nr:FAD-dependent oxidoreductase [Deltaproteobacteria bacterium]
MSRLSRRQSIALSLVGPPLAALAALALRHRGDPGETLDPAIRQSLRALTPTEFVVLRAAVARLCRSAQAGFPTATEVGVAQFAEGFFRDLPSRDLQDIKLLLAVIQHALPPMAGSSLPFTSAPPAAQDRVLALMETAPSGLLRSGFAALKQISALGFFRDERTWAAIGYEGPRVPPAGPNRQAPVRGAPIAQDARERYDVDVVIVGAGAGGCMAAREIARRGATVLLLEEGPDHPPEFFTQREDEMLPALYQDRAGRANRDRSIAILQGRGLGGSTIHNQNLCKRAPSVLLDRWAERGLTGFSARELDPYYREVERDLHITEIAAADVTENNALLKRGTDALGWHNAGLSHNRDGCTRSGFCELGCAYDGKNNGRKVLLPEAQRAGAIIRANTRVDRIAIREGHARGVFATDLRNGRPVVVTARAVVLASSAIGSAALALRSNVRDPFARIGRGLHIHPASVVAGIFADREVAGWRGIPQSIECMEHLTFEEGSERRVWIVPAFAHPGGTASMLPGSGPAWVDAMRKYPNLGVLTAMVHDESEGRVSIEHGRLMIDYELSLADRIQLAKGLRACGEILLAAGASEVVLPFARPMRVRSARQLSAIREGMLVPHALPLTAVHPMSAMRAGADPRKSVVDPHGQHHQVRGLYVADGGVFPTSIGGPPQLTIYTAAMKIARHVADALARS